MRKTFNLRRLYLLMSAAGLISFSSHSMASGFMLWEQDAASIANYHAGVSAIAEDASTNWYNAAGLTRIKNQQLVAGFDPILTDFRFSGTVDNHALFRGMMGFIPIPLGPQPVVAQGGTFSVVPFGHYAAPINDCFSFGLSVDVPFGLKTDYEENTFARYSATLTELQVIDVSPSLAFAITDKLSVGVGPDWQRVRAELDTTIGAIAPFNDSSNSNIAYSSAWGYHAGILYQFTSKTRVGLNYRSKVTHHAKGHSEFSGPIANGFHGGTQRSNHFGANVTLPPTTSLGIFHSVNPCWDLLGHVSYTQWDSFKNLALENVAGLNEVFVPHIPIPVPVPTNSLTVNIAEHYKNSWNASIGANFHATEKLTLRSGIGYDQSPTSNKFRNLQLPDSDRIGLGLGGHYQATKTVGLDMGWTHIFGMNTRINNLSQAFGPEVVTTDGSVKSSADVYGFGVKWDIT